MCIFDCFIVTRQVPSTKNHRFDFPNKFFLVAGVRSEVPTDHKSDNRWTIFDINDTRVKGKAIVVMLRSSIFPFCRNECLGNFDDHTNRVCRLIGTTMFTRMKYLCNCLCSVYVRLSKTYDLCGVHPNDFQIHQRLHRTKVVLYERESPNESFKNNGHIFYC